MRTYPWECFHSLTLLRSLTSSAKKGTGRCVWLASCTVGVAWYAQPSREASLSTERLQLAGGDGAPGSVPEEAVPPAQQPQQQDQQQRQEPGEEGQGAASTSAHDTAGSSGLPQWDAHAGK